jgi:hypothetical protein
MIKTTIQVLCTFTFSLLVFNSSAQEPVLKTESNGVVVHQATGVEGIVLTTTETPVQINSIDNWSIEQCEEVINYIKIKSKEGCSKKESEAYLEQLHMLEERVKVLKLTKSN